MLAALLTVLSIRYPSVVYVISLSHSCKQRCPSVDHVNSPSYSFKHIRYPPEFMLTVPLTVLSIRCPSIVYVNSPSHSFNYKVSTCMLSASLTVVNIGVHHNHTGVFSSETIDSDLGIEF